MHTAEQWQTLTDRISRAAQRSGIPHADSQDIAQDVATRHLMGAFARNADSLDGVFRMARAVARRAGTWYALSQTGDRDRKRAQRTAEGRYRFPVRDSNTAYPSPADMAAAAEAKGFPVDRIHAVYGIGPTALHEPGTTPDVIGSGPAWTMPAPIPADRYPTDPNPASRLAARLRCLEHLQALAAGSIQPRHQEQTAEPTADEQAEEARRAWLAFKRQGQRIDAGEEDRRGRQMGDALYRQ